MRVSRLAVLAGPSILLLASCGSEPADVRGSYTINITNGANGCQFDGWTPGDTSSTSLEIIQNDSDVTLDVGGVTGAFLDLVVGSSEFVGTVDGDHIDARLTGRGMTRDSCAYTIVVDLVANVEGDLIAGDLTWHPQTNELEDCGILNGCENTQAFNGARPPASTY